MNKTVLCRIRQEEMEVYESLHQNRATFYTLIQIKRENGRLNKDVADDIDEKIRTINQSLSRWWEKIAEKYGVPYYLDKKMLVDAETQEIYIE